MPLPFTVKTIEEVPEAFRGEYVEDKEVGFRLAVEGIEDPAELRRAKQRESEGRKSAEAELAKIRSEQAARDEEVRLAREEAAKKAGNIDELQKSWQEKFDKAIGETESKYKTENESLASDLNVEMIEKKATELAAALALPESADVLYPHIKARLRVEVRDGRRQTVVVDREGKASAATLADLKKEFAANKAFAPILAASRASGGGANGGKGGGAADKAISRAELEAMPPHSRAGFFKSGGTVFDP